MLLKLNTRFEGFTPTEMLGNSCSYREVYRATNSRGEEVALIVYNMRALPECYRDGGVPELELIPELDYDAFPEYMGDGKIEDDDIHLRWVATKYLCGKSLTDCIKEGLYFSEGQILTQFLNILEAVKEISRRLKGGSHNNINTDHIIVSETADGKGIWNLIGLNCMAEAAEGKPKFDTDILPVEFRAPETVVGRFNQTTDIFSLGVVLTLALQGKHPWKSVMSQSPKPTVYAVVKYLRAVKPELEISEPLHAIVAKALAAKHAERYQKLEELKKDIVSYLKNGSIEGNQHPDHFIPDLATKKDFGSKLEESRQEAPSRPKANVTFKKVRDGKGFGSVAGMGELKRMLTRNFIDIIKNRELAGQFRITPPNGILLWGPPGTGKTYLSKRLGEETGMLYSLIQPSDLGNIYIHGSQSMIADLFSKAEQRAKESGSGVLLVFDEFDSLVPKRGRNEDNNQANEVAEFLTQLNDCAERNVFVIATTNRIEAIDPAVIRKGRFDEVIYVGLPDEAARKELIELELANRPHEHMDTGHLAELTKGYTASDVAFIINECARCSFDESLKIGKLVKISQEQVEKIISTTRASVSSEELKEYERTRESYSCNKKKEKPRIGFRM